MEMPETPEMIARALTAYHEAGHVVAAHVLGALVYEASIKPGSEYLGVTALARMGRKTRPKVAVLLAGGVAEFFACRMRGWPADAEALAQGAGRDFEEIVRLFRRLSLPSRERVQEDASAQAQDILLAHWGLVETLMLALYERETLSALDVLAILKPPAPLPPLPVRDASDSEEGQ